MNKKLIVIAGPTCVGKSSYAVNLAKKLNADIFSADSRQLYKEMNIGTAKPSPIELSEVKHNFINHKSISDHYTVGDFEKEIITHLSSYYKTKDIAILCGGTGLYIDAVLNGLDDFPEISAKVKSQVNDDYLSKGLEFLCDELLEKDPEYYHKVDLKNQRRVTRAIEVIRQSNQSYSSFLTAPKASRQFESECYILLRDRKVLYQRINERVDLMIKDGLVEEAKSLLPFRKQKALQTVGYQELFSYFDGDYDIEEAIEKIKQNSRRYAKRQLTWLRKKSDWEIINL